MTFRNAFAESETGAADASAARLSQSGDAPARGLRVGIDVRGLETQTSLRRGIGRYVLNLLRAMVRLSPHHRYVLLGNKLPWDISHLAEFGNHPSIEYETFWPAFARDLDVLLLTDSLPVLRGRDLTPFPVEELPCAAIVYDLIPLVYEKAYLDPDPVLKEEYYARLERLPRLASRLLTISEFVATDVASRLKVAPGQVIPILGGLDDSFRVPPRDEDVRRILKKFSITSPYFFYTGGTDHRKNLVTLLEAHRALQKQTTRRVTLVMAGEFDPENFRDAGEDVIVPGYVSDDDLRALYGGAVAVAVPCAYEGLGLAAREAMGCRCPVIASNGTSLREIVGDAGILVDPRSVASVAEAMRKILEDDSVRDELRRRGSQRIGRYTWDDVAARALAALEGIARRRPYATAPSRKLRVLIQNRADAFSAPGGDTVVMEQLFRHLRRLDVDARVGVGAADLQGVDCVHLVNATLKEVGREVSENARRQGVPYVVTTLLEDWPRYLDKSLATLTLFKDYVIGGIPSRQFHDRLSEIRALPRSARVGNEDVVRRAALLLACGDSEAARLSEAYPGVENAIRVVKFGIRRTGPIQPQAVRRLKSMLHLDRFILCCGRLETRKNQLMLLKALEDSDLPIVLASGGFSYQPAYVELVKRFRRKGPVRIVGRLEDAVHAHLMAAAAVHVLPSWYELPGLVTLEAASVGTAVVASDWGAIRDYLPEGLVHCCQPDNPDSIRLAVENALADGPATATKTAADSLAWETFGEETLSAYESVLSRRAKSAANPHIKTEENHSTYHALEGDMNSPRSERPKYDVSIVMPVYNRWQLTQRCLESICGATNRATYEIIVVDNHSTDDTNRLLQAVEGDIVVLRQSANRGFAAACNAGARLAQGEHVLFLNNDTEVRSGWLDALLGCARAEENIGAVGAKLLYPAGDVQHAGIAISAKKVPYLIFQHFSADHPAVCETREMQAVTGACMMIPRAVFDQAGGFDEEYRNGFEDVDLCLRLRQSGLRIMYCAEATVIHREESSAGRKDRDRENLERFLALWSDTLVSDETELTARHGYTITWGSGGGTYRRIEDNPVLNAAKDRAEAPVRVTLDEARRRYEEGDLQGAANALQSVVEHRMTLAGQDSFEAWQLLGNCFTRLNKFDEAETAYHKAIESDDSSERPYLGLGTLAMLQENWQAAMYGYMTALAKNPNAMKAELGVGLSMSARKMYDAAIERFERVLSHEPDNAEALFYLYRTAMESGQPRRAVRFIESYLDRHPGDADFLFNLCGAYWKAGEIGRATELCQQLLKQEPTHAAARDVMHHLQETLAEHV